MGTPRENVEAGIQRLKEEGHQVATRLIAPQGTQKFEVDFVTCVSWEQMQHIGAGDYSFAELQKEFERQAAEGMAGEIVS